MKKFFKIAAFIIIASLVILFTYVLYTFPPVMTGMVAKTMCSCVYISGRTPESVKSKELQVFPGLSKADVEFNASDSSVTASILWQKSKAVFRNGLGCTLLAEGTEQHLRDQKINLPSKPLLNQDTILWPAGNRTNARRLAGVNMNLISQAVDSAFIDIDPLKPVYTHAVVVVYDGEIIAEKYADGINANSKLIGWSMTKSICNALIGILVKEGKLIQEAPAPVNEWKNDERKTITVNNLLQASSGLQWSESYFVPTSDFHNMFIKSDDKAAYAASVKLIHKPGEFFEYSSGTTNILSRIIRQQVGDKDYYRFPYEKLFYKIGMNNTVIELDASGTFVLSSYSYATARDWARFGLLYLQDGIWNGERILPEGWVAYTATPAPAAPRRQYGAQWWLNGGDLNNLSNKKYPGLPNECIVADGFEKQYVVLVPSKKLVVVRLGVTHNRNFSIAKLVNGVIKGLPE